MAQFTQEQELCLKRVDPKAVLPKRAHPWDAGLDLSTVESVELAPGASHAFRTGLAVAIPPGMVGLVADRSSMGKRGLKTFGGVIDAGYRGEVHVILRNLSSETVQISVGDRVAQLLVLPVFTGAVKEVESLDETSRGAQGFGSSGR